MGWISQLPQMLRQKLFFKRHAKWLPIMDRVVLKPWKIATKKKSTLDSPARARGEQASVLTRAYHVSGTLFVSRVLWEQGWVIRLYGCTRTRWACQCAYTRLSRVWHAFCLAGAMIARLSHETVWVCSYGMIWIRISDPRSVRIMMHQRNQWIRVTSLDLSVPLMHYDPSDDPDPDHPEGTHPIRTIDLITQSAVSPCQYFLPYFQTIKGTSDTFSYSVTTPTEATRQNSPQI